MNPETLSGHGSPAPIGMLPNTTTQSNAYVELSGVGRVCGTPTVP